MAVSTLTETVTVLRLSGDIGMGDMDAILGTMTVSCTRESKQGYFKFPASKTCVPQCHFKVSRKKPKI